MSTLYYSTISFFVFIWNLLILSKTFFLYVFLIKRLFFARLKQRVLIILHCKYSKLKSHVLPLLMALKSLLLQMINVAC